MDEKERIQGTMLKFIGQYDTYRDMMKRAERQIGNICTCYVKKRNGYCQYVYNGRCWVMMNLQMEEISLAGYGKCIVTDKLRVTGKGWVLIIDAKPNGMEIGKKIRSAKGFPFTIAGYGGLSHMTQKELILSPNTFVESEIQIGDVLEMVIE